MPSPLNGDDQQLMWDQHMQDISNLPAPGSLVIAWPDYNGGATRYVLVFHAADGRYFFTDISDLPQATIDNLAKQSVVHGILWYLPDAIIDTINSDYTAITSGGGVLTNVGDAAKQLASDIGQAIANLVGPTADTLIPDLTPIVVIVGLVALMYLYKKG